MKPSNDFSNNILVCVFCMILILSLPVSSMSILKYQSEKITEKNQSMDLAEITNESPPAVSSAAMAYDSESDRVVLFGGRFQDVYGFSNETWSYDFNTNTWMNMTPSNSPPVRYGHKMVYDSESDLIILFGGEYLIYPPLIEQRPYVYNDTWEFDLNSNTWTEMFPSTSPFNMTGHAMSYDSKEDLVIFFSEAQTWTYDVDANIWEELSPVSDPGNRRYHEMVYDSDSELTILYDGSTWDFLHDIYAYDYTANTWTQLNPTGYPSVYEHPKMVYDSGAHRIILFGESEQAETWSYCYDFNTWSEMEPKNQPTPRQEFCMAYDSESTWTILFSGLGCSADTWVYSYFCNEWLNMAWGTPSAISPSATTSAAMAYDVESDKVVLFGGTSGSYFPMSHSKETWSYDYNTNTWTNMTTPNSPSARFGHQMVYDIQSDLIILYGGRYGCAGLSLCGLNDTWTYDLNSNTWTEMSPSTCPGHFFDSFSMTYDSKEDRVVLFQWDQTWIYDVDSNTWEEMSPETHPTDQSISEMVYDENSECAVHCGGLWDFGFYLETWVYDLTSNVWTEMTTENRPPIFQDYMMTYDSQSDRSILFCNETWSYDVESNLWMKMSPKIQPTARLESCMAYDSESDRTILFGGKKDDFTGVYCYDDTWVYSYDSDEWWNMAWFVPDDETFSFIAYGDTRGEDPESVSPIHEDLVECFIQHDPELVIHTGDMVNHGGESYQWPFFNESISSLNFLHIPFYGTVGNHELYTDDWDVQDDDLSNYQDFFDYSDVIDQPGETELYYSFDANGIHFIFLNTAQYWEEENYICPATQMAWLENDLAGNHEFIVVSFHYPAWSIRADRPDRWATARSIRETFHDMFVDYGVDIVFNGHDHLYYRTVRDGINYVVTGGGGAPLAEIQKEGTVWQEGDVGFSDYHYCVAKDIDGNLNVEVFLLNGTIADSFSLDLPIPPSPFNIPLAIVLISSVALASVIVIIVLRKRRQAM